MTRMLGEVGLVWDNNMESNKGLLFASVKITKLNWWTLCKRLVIHCL